jgi:hypothetical protein
MPLVAVVVYSLLIVIYEAALYVVYEWCNGARRCLHLDASLALDGGSDKEWVKMTCHVFIRVDLSLYSNQARWSRQSRPLSFLFLIHPSTVRHTRLTIRSE